jgi:hypothetical protein
MMPLTDELPIVICYNTMHGVISYFYLFLLEGLAYLHFFSLLFYFFIDYIIDVIVFKYVGNIG